VPSLRSRVRRRAAVLLITAVASAIVCGCSVLTHTAAMGKGPWEGPPAAVTDPFTTKATVIAGGTPDALAAGLAGRLFSSAPVVVVAPSHGSAAVLKSAEQAAMAEHAPLLLGTNAVSGSLKAQLRRLHARDVLAVGLSPAALAARLPAVHVVTVPTALPATSVPEPLHGVAVLVHQGSAAQVSDAAATTARVAGARVITVGGWDPRGYPAAIKALAAMHPREVVAVGGGFGPASRLASRVAVAETGIQLPGGGQVMFPGRRLVCLYGHPGAPTLGVLGEQDLPASIERAREVAAQYTSLSKVPVVPTFEIIATVAQAYPGYDGMYSYATPLSDIQPWVSAATKAGMYVVLDLQPGRANLLDQAKLYSSLLKLPNVGLALDSEWKLQPGQKPLQQIGSVDVSEINSVIHWLAALTARDHLPQKLVVLHQFRLSMIIGEQNLDTSEDDLAILIHMDGQGTPGAKQSTWDAVTAAAPKHVWFGWKNFYVKDTPMISPQATMAETPTPVMISYQ
jgi:hypothetical protein